MNRNTIHLLLADDDKDDCLFFKEVLEELPSTINLTIVNDGKQQVEYLVKKTDNFPTILFIDLNMPRKNGYECLLEIKKHEKLKQISAIVYSTSCDPKMVNFLYTNGAKCFVQKPFEFSKLKKAVHHALTLNENTNTPQPSKEKFVIQP